MQPKLEGEKLFFLPSSFLYIVILVVPDCCFRGLLRGLEIEQGLVVATITRYVIRRP